MSSQSFSKMGVTPTSIAELHFPEVIIDHDCSFQSRAVPARSLGTGGDRIIYNRSHARYI